MKETILHAQRRNKEEKPKILRAEKMVPCEIYGNNKDNTSVKIDASELLKTYRKVGESHIITIDVEGEKIDALIHDYQKHPVTGEFIHMDFYAVTMGQKVNTAIKINFVGNSPAAKDGAILEEYIKEINVAVLPKDLVDAFDVDISALKEVGDAIRIADLHLNPEIFEHDHNDEDIVVIASAAVEEKIEEEAPEFEEAEVVGEDKDSETPKEDK